MVQVELLELLVQVVHLELPEQVVKLLFQLLYIGTM